MAIPSPDDVFGVIKVTPTTPDQFISDLSTAMADKETVSNSLRPDSRLVFYVPGYLDVYGAAEVRKQLTAAEWNVAGLNQQQGYMPTNAMTDYRNADPSTPGVQGNRSFPWVLVTLTRGSKKPSA